MTPALPTDDVIRAMFREHAPTSREGAAFLARIDRTKSRLRESAPLQRFVIRFAGIDGEYHEFARSRVEAVESAAASAGLPPSHRCMVCGESIEVQP